MKKISILLIGTCLVLVFVMNLINSLYSEREYATFNSNYGRVWMHRGGSPANTVEGIVDAVTNKKYPGVEIDLFYDDSKDSFIVSHDPPVYEKKAYKTLEFVLSKLSGLKLSLWLDLKNLSDQNLKGVKKRILSLKDKFPHFNSFVVESANYAPLRELSFSDINTVYWINPHAKSRLRVMRNLVNKLKVINANFVGVSTYYTQYYDSIGRDDLLEKIPLYIFTVNEDSIVNDLYRRENVKVILSKSVKPEVLNEFL